MWLIFLLVSGVAAHMPTDNCNLGQTQEKSWAAYIDVDGFTECEIDVNVGETVGLSVSVPYDKNPDDVSVFYDGLPCTEPFTGWGKEAEVHYEAFGVGAYRLVKACKGKVVGAHGNNYVHIDIRTNKTVPVSVGVGEVETFTVGELFTMPIHIARTWYWEGHDSWWVPGVVLLVLRYAYFVYMYYCEFALNFNALMSLNMKGLPYFAITMVWFSCVTFAYRILYLYKYWDGMEFGSAVLHVFVPYLLSLCIGFAYSPFWCCGGNRDLIDAIGKIALALYFAFFLWMGWWIPTFFLLLEACLKLYMNNTCRNPCEVTVTKGTHMGDRVWRF